MQNYAEQCGSCDSEEGDPVCGSDGPTYLNMCLVEPMHAGGTVMVAKIWSGCRLVSGTTSNLSSG